ncbi:MAG: flagellar motor protein [Vicinamibacterales bacterium]
MATKPRRPGRRSRIDFGSLLGAPVAIGLILVGQAIEGGSVRSLLQFAAALVVFGGTLGAVLLSNGSADVLNAGRSLRGAYSDTLEPAAVVIARVLVYASRARRSGILSLEAELESEPDLFLRRALRMAVDGSSQSEIRHALELEMELLADREDVPARVFESAGGYAPTIGILGAVIGLIQVMGNLADPAKLGAGVAVAFVATIYGVGSANLILLPVASKLRQRAEASTRRREMLIDAALAVQEGLNPRLIEQRFSGHTGATARVEGRPSLSLRERMS